MQESKISRKGSIGKTIQVANRLCDFGSACKRQKAKWFHVHMPPHPFVLVQQKDHIRIGNLMREGVYAERLCRPGRLMQKGSAGKNGVCKEVIAGNEILCRKGYAGKKGFMRKDFAGKTDGKILRGQGGSHGKVQRRQKLFIRKDYAGKKVYAERLCGKRVYEERLCGK